MLSDLSLCNLLIFISAPSKKSSFNTQIHLVWEGCTLTPFQNEFRKYPEPQRLRILLWRAVIKTRNIIILYDLHTFGGIFQIQIRIQPEYGNTTLPNSSYAVMGKIHK